MLCTVNTEVGGVGNDQKSRHFNLMSSIVAIATAAPGATPTNNPVNSSGTRNTNYNCITVLSNTDGGGWTAGNSNAFSPSATFNASAAAQFLDLYRVSGKSTYPWYRISFSAYAYPFNSSFTSYPFINYSAGCTSSDPSTTAITSAENGYKYAYTSPSSTTSMTTAWDYSEYNDPTNTNRMRFDESGKTWYVACTQNYLIIANNEQMWYWGVRSVGGWELARTDNPPWVHFTYNRKNYYGMQASVSHTDRAIAWSAGLKPDATQQAAALFGQHQMGTSNCALTGQAENDYKPFANHLPGTGLANDYRRVRAPLFNSPLASNYGPYNYASTSYQFPFESPIADSVTGLNVPPVYPVVFHSMDYQNGAGASGVAPGIYKGMCTNTTGLDQFVTAASYTVGSDTYIPIRTGHATFPDLWLLRSA